MIIICVFAWRQDLLKLSDVRNACNRTIAEVGKSRERVANMGNLDLTWACLQRSEQKAREKAKERKKKPCPGGRFTAGRGMGRSAEGSVVGNL